MKYLSKSQAIHSGREERNMRRHGGISRLSCKDDHENNDVDNNVILVVADIMNDTTSDTNDDDSGNSSMNTSKILLSITNIICKPYPIKYNIQCSGSDNANSLTEETVGRLKNSQQHKYRFGKNHISCLFFADQDFYNFQTLLTLGQWGTGGEEGPSRTIWSVWSSGIINNVGANTQNIFQHKR